MDKIQIELDEMDLMLLKQLEVDSRQSNRSLSIKLNTSAETVRRRLNRLTNAGLVSIVTFSNPLALGLQMALIGINARPGKIDALAGYLGKYQTITSIMITTGRYDMLVTATFRDQQELAGFVEENLGASPDLVDAEMMMVLSLKKFSLMYLSGNGGASSGTTSCILDETDLALIKELEMHPRQSVTDLTRKLALSRTLVNRKLQTLLEQDIIKVINVVNPAAIGFAIQASVLIKADLSKISAVAGALMLDTRVHQLSVVSGRFNLWVWAIFRDLGEMTEFVKNTLGNIPGITRYETMLQLGLPKASLSLLTKGKVIKY